MRKFFYIACMLCAVSIASAQEINCTVTINSDQIEGSNKQVFETLKAGIQDYISQNRWTNMTYAEHEKIECSMLIIVNEVADNMYKCEMTLQTRRPLYAATELRG